MLETLSSLGLDLVKDSATGLISAEKAKLSQFIKHKKAISNSQHEFDSWHAKFLDEYDGTIVTRSTFDYYIRYHHIHESMASYILSSTPNQQSQDVFISDLKKSIVTEIQRSYKRQLDENDKHAITEYINQSFQLIASLPVARENSGDKHTLYLLCQLHAYLVDLNHEVDNSGHAINEIKLLLQELTQLKCSDAENFDRIFSLLSRNIETKESLSHKILSWNSRQIQNLGNRYIPNVNIALPLSKVLHGACIDFAFIDELQNATDTFLVNIRKQHLPSLDDVCTCIGSAISSIYDVDSFNINIQTILTHTAAMSELVSEQIQQILNSKTCNNNQSRADDYIHKLYLISAYINDYDNYLQSDAVKAALSPYILLSGDGGTGKSHLIADFITGQSKLAHLNILFLGQQIIDPARFLEEFPQKIGFSGSYLDLFHLLDEFAIEQGCRMLICIDALNEGPGIKFWNNTLSGLIDFMKEYHHLGLLVSVRSQYVKPLFKEQDNLKLSLLEIKHHGFASVSNEAMNRYFLYYKIKTDSIVFPRIEFDNPLFLRLFCVAYQNAYVKLDSISLLDVYTRYINYVEDAVSEKCGYNSSYKLVTKILDQIISTRLDSAQSASFLPLTDAVRLICTLQKDYGVSKDLYSALLSEGILTQSILHNGMEYVHITYERMEDYFLAQQLLLRYESIGESEFSKKYQWIQERNDLLQYFGIVLAETNHRELFDVFDTVDDDSSDSLLEAFLYTFVWRNSSSITQHTLDVLNAQMFSESSFLQFVDILFALSTRIDHPLNAENSFHFFAKPVLADRDATFVPIFTELYNDPHSSLSRLLNWVISCGKQQQIEVNTALYCSLILGWLLISPNITLRDTCTKALVLFLKDRIPILISFIKHFEKIDDPYIQERLYAIAFGCIVNQSDSYQTKLLAEYVYHTVFDKNDVYANILLRTYAKDIVDFALYTKCIDSSAIDNTKIQPPYKSTFPVIPSDEEIEQYDLDHSSKDFKPYQWAQLNILCSMEVEYDRDGNCAGYGDFGRYIFQSYFSDWTQLKPQDLKNIAIKRIFDLGYNAKKHGSYDRLVKSSSYYMRYHKKSDRIGKKYQWIALYELAALVSDNFTLSIESHSDGIDSEHCLGSFEPDIRNIDPTVLISPKFADNECTSCFSYTIPECSYDDWITDYSSIPSFNECVRLLHHNHTYLLLEGQHTWIEPKMIGCEQYSIPRKRMWRQIRSYIVKAKYLDQLLASLTDVDFMGRWMPESPSNYSLYNREDYWSTGYAFFQCPYYGGCEWTMINSHALDTPFNHKILLPSIRYVSERDGDLVGVSSHNSALTWYKPCREIVQSLHLQYEDGSNSVFTDSDGNLVCFDSTELLEKDTGLFIREDKLIEFLEKNDYAIIWTSLCEKEILTSDFSKADTLNKRLHLSSVYTLQNHSIVEHSCKLFDN